MDYLGSSNLHHLFTQHPYASFPDYLAHHFTLSVLSDIRCRDPSRGTQVTRIDCKNNLETKKVRLFPKSGYKRTGGTRKKGLFEMRSPHLPLSSSRQWDFILMVAP